MYIIKQIYHLVIDPKIPTLASALAFFIVLNGGSFIFLLTAIFSYLPFDIISFIDNNLADFAFKNVLLYLFKYNSSLSYSIILIITSIYSASSLYYHFLNACEILTKRVSKYSLLKRIIAIIVLPIIIFLIIFSICILIYLSFLDNYIYNIISIIFIILIILMILYILNFIALGDYKLRRSYKGIIFSFCYFIMFSLLFILYLKLFSSFKIVYGVLAFIIILMFYIYSLAIGLLIGIYINCKNLDLLKYIFKK